MKSTEVVIQNYKSYRDKLSAKFMADGKIDTKELNTVFTAVISNQAALAKSIQELYEILARIEKKL